MKRVYLLVDLLGKPIRTTLEKYKAVSWQQTGKGTYVPLLNAEDINGWGG